MTCINPLLKVSNWPTLWNPKRPWFRSHSTDSRSDADRPAKLVSGPHRRRRWSEKLSGAAPRSYNGHCDDGIICLGVNDMDRSILKVHLPNGGFNIVKCGEATDIRVSTCCTLSYLVITNGQEQANWSMRVKIRYCQLM